MNEPVTTTTIINTRKGRIPWNKGKKGLQVAWNKGKKTPLEVRRKQSLAHITTGSTSEHKRFRKSVDFINWRNEVFKRDNFTCRKCLKRGLKLHPHHIGSFSKYKGFRFEVDNGITLCEKCHAAFHKKYGYKEFNSEEIITFLY